jgi:hypothetical protein
LIEQATHSLSASVNTRNVHENKTVKSNKHADVGNTEPRLRGNSKQGVETQRKGSERSSSSVDRSDSSTQRPAQQIAGEEIVRPTAKAADSSGNNLSRHKIRRIGLVDSALDKFSQDELQKLYNESISLALSTRLKVGGKTGVAFMIESLSKTTYLRASDATQVRKYLHEHNVVMHKRDTRYIRNSKTFWSKSKTERKNLTDKRADGLQKHWDKLSPSERASRGEAISNAPRQSIRTKEQKKARRQGLEDLTYGVYQAALEGRTRTYSFLKKIEGRYVLFESKPEYALFKLLRKLGVEFSFSTEPPGNWIWIKSRFWNPDFVIGDIIIEVKGRMFRADFERDVLPEFKRSRRAKEYTLYILDRNVDGERYKDLKSLLKTMVRVHVE